MPEGTVTIGPIEIPRDSQLRAEGRDLLYVYPPAGEPFTVRISHPDRFKKLIEEYYETGKE